MATDEPNAVTPEPPSPGGRAPLPWEQPPGRPKATVTGWAAPGGATPSVQGAHWVTPTEDRPALADVQLGGYVPRILAYVLDALLVAIWIILVIEVAPIGRGSSSSVLLAALVVALLGFAYFPWCWTHGGRTIGMRLFGLRVVREADGGPVRWGPAVIRLFGYWVNGILLYLGWLWVFIDKRRRGFHDLLARTIVVDEASLRASQERSAQG